MTAPSSASRSRSSAASACCATGASSTATCLYAPRSRRDLRHTSPLLLRPNRVFNRVGSAPLNVDSVGGTNMLRKILILAAVLAVPSALAAQGVPNSNASDTAKSKVAAHRQNPQVPAQEASDVAKSKVAQHQSTRVRGSAVGLDNRPATPATRAVPATPNAGGAATSVTPAVPASPSQKPSDAGSQAGSHRP